MADIGWTLRLCLILLVTHALAYLSHEYAHSVTAWALGWMGSPFALDYGRPTFANLSLLSDVSDNVSYDPIVASGPGRAAACIALAGPFLGNGMLYVLVTTASRRFAPASRVQPMAFGFCLMCAGNLWSYVPIRTFTDHADIALAARGLGVGTVLLGPLLLIPTLGIAWHFFHRACLGRWFVDLASGSPARHGVLCAVTSYWFFVFLARAPAAVLTGASRTSCRSSPSTFCFRSPRRC